MVLLTAKEVDAFYNTVVDRIVDMVWEKFPKDEKSRLAVYERLSESFAGLVRVFDRPVSKFEVPEEEEKEESEEEQTEGSDS